MFGRTNSNSSAPVHNTGTVDSSGFVVYDWNESPDRYAARAPHTPAPETPRHTVHDHNQTSNQEQRGGNRR